MSQHGTTQLLGRHSHEHNLNHRLSPLDIAHEVMQAARKKRVRDDATCEEEAVGARNDGWSDSDDEVDDVGGDGGDAGANSRLQLEARISQATKAARSIVQKMQRAVEDAVELERRLISSSDPRDQLQHLNTLVRSFRGGGHEHAELDHLCALVESSKLAAARERYKRARVDLEHRVEEEHRERVRLAAELERTTLAQREAERAKAESMMVLERVQLENQRLNEELADVDRVREEAEAFFRHSQQMLSRLTSPGRRASASSVRQHEHMDHTVSGDVIVGADQPPEEDLRPSGRPAHQSVADDVPVQPNLVAAIAASSPDPQPREEVASSNPDPAPVQPQPIEEVASSNPDPAPVQPQPSEEVASSNPDPAPVQPQPSEEVASSNPDPAPSPPNDTPADMADVEILCSADITPSSVVEPVSSAAAAAAAADVPAAHEFGTARSNVWNGRDPLYIPPSRGTQPRGRDDPVLCPPEFARGLVRYDPVTNEYHAPLTSGSMPASSRDHIASPTTVSVRRQLNAEESAPSTSQPSGTGCNGLLPYARHPVTFGKRPTRVASAITAVPLMPEDFLYRASFVREAILAAVGVKGRVVQTICGPAGDIAPQKPFAAWFSTFSTMTTDTNTCDFTPTTPQKGADLVTMVACMCGVVMYLTYTYDAKADPWCSGERLLKASACISSYIASQSELNLPLNFEAIMAHLCILSSRVSQEDKVAVQAVFQGKNALANAKDQLELTGRYQSYFTRCVDYVCSQERHAKFKDWPWTDVCMKSSDRPEDHRDSDEFMNGHTCYECKNTCGVEPFPLAFCPTCSVKYSYPKTNIATLVSISKDVTIDFVPYKSSVVRLMCVWSSRTDVRTRCELIPLAVWHHRFVFAKLLKMSKAGLISHPLPMPKAERMSNWVKLPDDAGRPRESPPSKDSTSTPQLPIPLPPQPNQSPNTAMFVETVRRAMYAPVEDHPFFAPLHE